jgi:hypothetical protein
MQLRNEAADRAKRIVEFWKNRKWLPSNSPLHVHQLDLTKLEELITDALEEPTREKP